MQKRLIAGLSAATGDLRTGVKTAFMPDLIKVETSSNVAMVRLFWIIGAATILLGLASIPAYLALPPASTLGARKLTLGEIIDVDPFLYAYPFNLLIFPIGWIGFVFVVAGARIVFAKILGEKQILPGEILMVTIYGAMPLVLAACLLRSTNLLFPFRDMADRQGALYLRVAAILMVFVVAWLLEGRTVTVGLMHKLRQNRGRAVLTWLSPYGFAVVMWWFAATLLDLLFPAR